MRRSRRAIRASVAAKRPRDALVDRLIDVVLVAFCCLMLLPIAFLVANAFKTQQELLQWPPTVVPANPTMENVRSVLGETPLLRWVANSLVFAILSTIAIVATSSITGYILGKFRFRGVHVLFALILATMMLPAMVLMIPTFLIWNKVGNWTEAHTLFSIAGHDFPPRIGTRTQYPLWMGNLFGSAFYIFLLRQFFLGIPRDLFEAARVDGDSYLSMFRRIALPLAKPALIVVFIFEFQAKWFDLMTPLIYLAGTDAKLFTLPLGLKTILDSFGLGGGGEGEWHVIIAGTVLTVLPMLILFAIFQRYFVEGIATQGRKG